MKSYRSHTFFLVITLSLLNLLSSPVVTRVRAVAEKVTAQLDQRNEKPAFDADWCKSFGLLSKGAAPPALDARGRLEPVTAPAGLTFTVNSTADPGTGTCDPTECTLREAITAANAAPGSDTIAFNIPGAGPHTITPATALPSITSPVVIDGYTQPGASANTLADDDNAVLMIQLDGSVAGALSMLSIGAGSSKRFLDSRVFDHRAEARCE